MLIDYWRQKDLNTGETWLSFAQRTRMDAVSIAYGQAWQDHIETKQSTQPEPRTISTKRSQRVLGFGSGL